MELPSFLLLCMKFFSLCPRSIVLKNLLSSGAACLLQTIRHALNLHKKGVQVNGPRFFYRQAIYRDYPESLEWKYSYRPKKSEKCCSAPAMRLLGVYFSPTVKVVDSEIIPWSIGMSV